MAKNNALAPDIKPSNSLLGYLTEPFIVNKQATDAAMQAYPLKEQVDMRGDAFRHLVGSALLAKRKGVPYAEFITGLHEAKWLPVIGGMGNSPAETQMDTYNNTLGIDIAKKAKSYDDIVNLAKQYIETNRAKTMAAPSYDSY